MHLASNLFPYKININKFEKIHLQLGNIYSNLLNQS